MAGGNCAARGVAELAFWRKAVRADWETEVTMTVDTAHTEDIATTTLVVEEPVERLMRLAERAQFFRSTDGRLFARVPVDNRSEVYELRSGAFRDWLIGGYFRECQKLPSNDAVRRVLGALEAFARFDGGTPSIFVRVGSGGGGGNGDPVYYVDLGDSSGQAVEIGAGGWSVVGRPGVQFERPGGQLPLPLPVRGGSIELLRPYVNLCDRDFRLLVVWMAAALRPAGPYPILALYGEQGSAKSTLAKIVRLLIDPQSAPLLSEPRSTRDMMVTAVNGWLLAYDNIGVISSWLSDGLCLLATGGGFAGRALFSNTQRTCVHAQRPVILNGIEEFVRRGDLSDRTVVLRLAPIRAVNRRREDQFWAAFLSDQPRILGALFDAVAGGLRELPSVNVPKLPRMADFAAFGEAVGRALGWKPGTMLSAYKGNRKEATATQIEESSVATALLEGARYGIKWRGTATQLLEELNEMVGKKRGSLARWPKTPSGLTNELRRIAPALRSRGMFILFERDYKNRRITIRKTGD